MMAFIEKMITRLRMKFNKASANEILTHNKDEIEDRPNIDNIDNTSSKLDNMLAVSDKIVSERSQVVKNSIIATEGVKSVADINIANSILQTYDSENPTQDYLKELPENANEVNIKMTSHVFVASTTEIFCNNTVADISNDSITSLDNITLDNFSESEELPVNNSIMLSDFNDKNNDSEKTITLHTNVDELIDRNNNIVDRIDTLEENIDIAELQSKINSKTEINFDEFEDLYTDDEPKHKTVEDFDNLIEKFVFEHHNSNDRSSETVEQNIASVGQPNNQTCSEVYSNDKEPEYINANTEELENILENTLVKTRNKLPNEEVAEINDEIKGKQENSEHNEIICISSEDETTDIDLPITLSDIDSISISSIETINTSQSNSSEATQENLVNTKSPLIKDLVAFNTIEASANNTNNIDDNSSDGYHSSDFEFITEEEAAKDGLIINYKPKKITEKETCRTLAILRDTGFKPKREVAGPSNVRTLRPPKNDYRQNHRVPEGDEYLNLFQGVFAPSAPLYLENKSTNSSPMLIQYQGMGFDMRVMSRQIRECESDNTYQLEAKQNELKILEAYPAENRKRRRRY